MRRCKPARLMRTRNITRIAIGSAMVADIKYKFSGHQTFVFRYGWLEKGVRGVHACPRSCTSSLRVIPPPSKPGTMALHHTTMRGHGHDSVPCLLPTRDSGAPVALRYLSLDDQVFCP